MSNIEYILTGSGQIVSSFRLGAIYWDFNSKKCFFNVLHALEPWLLIHVSKTRVILSIVFTRSQPIRIRQLQPDECNLFYTGGSQE